MNDRDEVKEYLDHLINLKFEPEDIILIFEYRKDNYTEGFHNLLKDNQEYNYLLKLRTVDNLKAHAKKLQIKKPNEYYSINKVKERIKVRTLIKEYWNIRVEFYAKFKGLPKEQIWDKYMKDPMICEEEIYKAVLKVIYGDNVPEYEYRDTPFWLSNHDDIWNKNYINEDAFEDTEGLAWKILIKDKVQFDDESNDNTNNPIVIKDIT